MTAVEKIHICTHVNLGGGEKLEEINLSVFRQYFLGQFVIKFSQCEDAFSDMLEVAYIYCAKILCRKTQKP